MDEMNGLYFHIPFCRNKCPYCDFYSTKYNPAEAERYTDEVCREIKKYHGTFDTVYFGGGTPSIMPSEMIGRIIAAARQQFTISPDSEITIECNPGKDLSDDMVRYAEYGINRVSIGMQSAVDSERYALGRVSDKNQVAKAIADARRAGITNISLDLMIGTPKQTLQSLDETFGFIRDMGVPHISAYMLKIEPNTKFHAMHESGRLALPDEDTVAEMYTKTVETLGRMGLAQYEISNFAREGYESRHNTKYWRLVPYLGIGKSAHSYWNGRRFYYDHEWNIVPDGDGGSPEERIMLGLRLSEGIPKTLITKPYGHYVQMGLMTETDDRIALTPSGMLVSNTIINSLI